MNMVDTVNQKVIEINETVRANQYSAATDEGFLEIDPEDYEDCFDIDVGQIKSLLDREVGRLQQELDKA